MGRADIHAGHIAHAPHDGAELPQAEFGLVVGEPVRFRFFGSSVRRDDHAGDVLDRWTQDELVELQEIEAQLPTEGHAPGEIITVQFMVWDSSDPIFDSAVMIDNFRWQQAGVTFPSTARP